MKNKNDPDNIIKHVFKPVEILGPQASAALEIAKQTVIDQCVVNEPEVITVGDVGQVREVNSIEEEAAAQQQVNLSPFPDGQIFRYAPNPKNLNTWVVYNVEQNIIAITPTMVCADLICKAVFLFMMSMKLEDAMRNGSAPTTTEEAMEMMKPEPKL